MALGFITEPVNPNEIVLGENFSVSAEVSKTPPNPTGDFTVYDNFTLTNGLFFSITGDTTARLTTTASGASLATSIETQNITSSTPWYVEYRYVVDGLPSSGFMSIGARTATNASWLFIPTSGNGLLAFKKNSTNNHRSFGEPLVQSVGDEISCFIIYDGVDMIGVFENKTTGFIKKVIFTDSLDANGVSLVFENSGDGYDLDIKDIYFNLGNPFTFTISKNSLEQDSVITSDSNYSFTKIAEQSDVSQNWNLNVVSGGEEVNSPFKVKIYEEPSPVPIYDILQGDPKMFITADGMTLRFVGGVPVMDSGLENVATISLGTLNGFSLNKIASNGGEDVGSSFIAESLKSITRDQIRVLEDAAEKSFQWAINDGLILSVSATVGIGESDGYELTLVLTPPTGENRILVYNKNGENWINQKWSE